MIAERRNGSNIKRQGERPALPQTSNHYLICRITGMSAFPFPATSTGDFKISAEWVAFMAAISNISFAQLQFQEKYLIPYGSAAMVTALWCVITITHSYQIYKLCYRDAQFNRKKVPNELSSTQLGESPLKKCKVTIKMSIKKVVICKMTGHFHQWEKSA